jgi:uncharacterized membrane protein YgcG
MAIVVFMDGASLLFAQIDLCRFSPIPSGRPVIILNMRFRHPVLLAALAIAPVCPKRKKVSDEQGIVDSTLSAVGGVDCSIRVFCSSGGGGGSGGGCGGGGGGGSSGSGGRGCEIIRRSESPAPLSTIIL